MGFSLGKILWQIWSWLFKTSLILFFVVYFLLPILITLQIKPGFQEFMTIVLLPYIVFTVVRLVSVFPLWIQGIYLLAYIKFGQQIILKYLTMGMIDYNFNWFVPNKISLFLDISGGTYGDLIFKLGLGLSIIFCISTIENRLLLTAAKNGVAWAKEILQTRLTKARQPQEISQSEVEKEETLATPLSVPQEIKERVELKPNFFRDRLWYIYVMILIIVMPLPLIAFSLSQDKGGEVFSLILGGSFILILLIMLPFIIWEASTRIIIEMDKIIIKAFLFYKKTILFKDIKGINTAVNGSMEITYEEQRGERCFIKTICLFPWPFTTTKVIQELKIRLRNITISENYILKRVKAVRSITNITVCVVTVGLLMGFIYYLISRIQNRPIFTEKECANQFTFWVNNRDKMGIAETKEDFRAELSQNAPLYFWIKIKVKAQECKENITFTIFDQKNKVIFQSNHLTLDPMFKTGQNNGVIYYKFENQNIFPQKGNYLLQVNYGAILVKELNIIVK